MSSKLDEILKTKVYPKGQIVIPVSLRKKYNIDIGDHIQVIPSRDGIILKPSSETKSSKVLTDNLFGIFRKYAHGKQKPTKKEVIKSTENGFIEGCKE